MPDIFNPQEILQIAVTIEENGSRLYGHFEKKTADTKLKKIWQFLKDQEEQHRQVFASMLLNLDEYLVHEYARGEYDAYLGAIAANHVFTERFFEDRTYEKFSSQDAALDFAIGIEKESILLYSAFRRHVRSEKQASIDKIIHEEEKHLIQLTELKNLS